MYDAGYFLKNCCISRTTWYILLNMVKKSLRETNPYLKDPHKRQADLHRCVISSSAVEGIHVSLRKTKPASPRHKATSRSAGTVKQPR